MNFSGFLKNKCIPIVLSRSLTGNVGINVYLYKTVQLV